MSRPSPQELVDASGATGVTDERILNALRTIPRAEFVPDEQVGAAYRDAPVPIPHGQVTTQPSLSAGMIEALELAEDEHVLEVGTGLGFQTALLSRVAGSVVTVEWWSGLTEQAVRNFERCGIDNVEAVTGDGGLGVPRRAPYDAVLVSAAFPEVAEPLVQQLREGGRLAQPIGEGGHESVVLFRRGGGGLVRRRVLTGASFVPLYGEHGVHP